MAERRARPPRERPSTDRAAPHEPAAAPPPLCSVAFCPICTVVTAIGEARPELTEHLLVASRELLLAFRAIIDARLEGMPERPAKLERLSIE